MYTSPFLSRPGKSSYLPGSCLVISNTMIVERPPICESLEKSCCTLNVVCCFVVCKCAKTAVISVYRSHSTAVKAGLDDLQLIISELKLHAKHIIIAGDFNIDILANSSTSIAYSNLLTDLQLFQHVSEPSRVTPVSSTLIDHFITTPKLKVNSVCQAVGLSDHLVQVVDNSNIRSLKPAKSVIYVRSYRHCDWDAMRECLRTAPWHVMDIFDDINDKWHFFKSRLYYALNQYAPLKRVVSKCSKWPTPWLTDDLLLAIKEKQHTKRRAARTHHPDDMVVYKKLKNKLKVSVHEVKLWYLYSLLDKSKSDPHIFHDFEDGPNLQQV